MSTQLAAPIAVWTSLSSDGATLTVNWTDPNGAALVGNFTVTFFSASHPPYPPTPSTTSGYATSLAIPAQTAANAPTPAALSASYSANVVANPTNTAQYSSSQAGRQIFAQTGAALAITVGGTQFNLLPDPGGSGVYRLATTPATTISLADLTTFAGASGVASTNVPQRWPNDSPILGTLTLSKLAVYPPLGLFELGISQSFGAQSWTPFHGFSVNQVALSVLRSDGIHLS